MCKVGHLEFLPCEKMGKPQGKYCLTSCDIICNFCTDRKYSKDGLCLSRRQNSALCCIGGRWERAGASIAQWPRYTRYFFSPLSHFTPKRSPKPSRWRAPM